MTRGLTDGLPIETRCARENPEAHGHFETPA